MRQLDERDRAHRMVNARNEPGCDSVVNYPASPHHALAELEPFALKAVGCLSPAAKVGLASLIAFDDFVLGIFTRLPAVVR